MTGKRREKARSSRETGTPIPLPLSAHQLLRSQRELLLKHRPSLNTSLYFSLLLLLLVTAGGLEAKMSLDVLVWSSLNLLCLLACLLHAYLPLGHIRSYMHQATALHTLRGLVWGAGMLVTVKYHVPGVPQSFLAASAALTSLSLLGLGGLPWAYSGLTISVGLMQIAGLLLNGGPLAALLSLGTALYTTAILVTYLDTNRLTQQELISTVQRDLLLSETLDHSRTDPLTSLLNRRGLEHALLQRLQSECAPSSCDAPSGVIGLAVLDIDNFKEVNDTYTHTKGDAVLRAVGIALQHVVGASGEVARYGGEEFAALLWGKDEDEVLRRCEALRVTVTTLRFEQLPQLHVSVSTGLHCMSLKDAQNSALDILSQLYLRADTLMYLAKAQGKNQVASSLLVSAEMQRAFDLRDLTWYCTHWPLISPGSEKVNESVELMHESHPGRIPGRDHLA